MADRLVTMNNEVSSTAVVSEAPDLWEGRGPASHTFLTAVGRHMTLLMRQEVIKRSGGKFRKQVKSRSDCNKT